MFGGLATVWGISMAVSTFGNFTLITAHVFAELDHRNGTAAGLLRGFRGIVDRRGASAYTIDGKWGWNILYISSAILILLSINSVTGVMCPFVRGRLVGMLIRFAAGTKNQGAWGEDLVQALNGIGLHITSLKRRMDVDLSRHARLRPSTIWSKRSRLYDAVDDWGRAFVVSALDSQARTAGYVKQLWQWVRFTGVAMRRDRSPREATQHHMAMILGPAERRIAQCQGLRRGRHRRDFDPGAARRRHHARVQPQHVVRQGRHRIAAFPVGGEQARVHASPHHTGHPARLESGTPIIAGWQNGDDASAAPNMHWTRCSCWLLLGVERHRPYAIAAPADVVGDEQLIDLAPHSSRRRPFPPARGPCRVWNKHIVDDRRAEMRALAPQGDRRAMGRCPCPGSARAPSSAWCC